MRVTGVKPSYYPFQIPEEIKSKSLEEKYMDPESVVRRYRYYCEIHEFLGESFPNLNNDMPLEWAEELMDYAEKNWCDVEGSF